MGNAIHIVDVFTERALAGNQLAVVLDAEGISDEAMQRIAREMNFSETTFVLPPEEAGHAARLRIFTPGRELPFAGHPTLGTAWVLHNQARIAGGALEFVLEETVGPVPIRVDRGRGVVRLWMTDPALTFGDVVEQRVEIADGLGLHESDLVPNVPIQVAGTGNKFLYVALKDASAVDRATPGKGAPSTAFGERTTVGELIFAVAGPGRLYSRMFAAGAGVAEDPATGSAGGGLVAFCVRYGLVPRSERVSIVSEQGTAMGRQSFIHVELTYAGGGDIPSRIEVGGSVVPVVTGTLVGADT